MSDRVSEMPETTEALVELQEYLRECQDVAQHQLKEEIDEAANRLKFFLDYAFFTSKPQTDSNSSLIMPSLQVNSKTLL